MDEPVICVVGSLNIDTTYTVREIPQAGETILADSRKITYGGKGANQAAAAVESGGVVAFVAAVGNDEYGSDAIEDLVARGVDVEAVDRLTEHPTGSAVILVGADGENVIVVEPGANRALASTWVREHVDRLAPSVILGQLEIPSASLLAAARAAPEATFVLNPAPMPVKAAEVELLLELADVLVPNRTELGQLVGRAEPMTLSEVDHCAEALDFHGALVVTLGAEGVAVYQGARRIVHVPAMDVQAVDTSGAGDAFCGGLAHCLALGESLEDAVRWATRLAGTSTTHRGARLPAGAINRSR